jgi:peptide/nickel transport system permease protein
MIRVPRLAGKAALITGGTSGIGGSIIVSVVLGLPSVGPLLPKALIAMDMSLAGTIILLISVLTVVGSLISDLLLVWIDPRIRM